ncbi:acyltransferase family protein [Citrobacter sp. S2-9]|uniref:Acyltransferase family protein n=1 Tax=Citrobacter enshiensis TaxID=2971264 RepID=A0ABT8PWM5_9ENTR|nr:acyltransferase family protein [Citrobacter enshiensis]MDN8600669.1 acyltransferase family protein [Citrobacter enshiensis]
MLSKSHTEQLKGISIILVMAGHLITLNKLSLPQEWRFLATFSVDVFLVLSGYGLTKSFCSKGLKSFFSKRLMNVALPFIVANVFIYAFYGHQLYDLTSFFRTITFNMFELKLDGTMWFIYFIIMWYVLFWLIFLLPFEIKTKSLIAFSISIAIHLYATKIPYAILAGQFSLHAFSFPLGIIIAAYNQNNHLKNCLIASILSTLFILSYYSLFQKFTLQNYVFCCVLYGLAASFIFPLININSTILEWFGKYSYEAYLVEGIFFRFNYSKVQLFNAAIFFFLTMASAMLLQLVQKKIISTATHVFKRA